MARGTVVEVDVVEDGTPTTRVGVVIEARPAGSPTKVKVLWEPVSALRVTEHAWPPARARILGVADLKIARAPRKKAAAPADEPLGFAAWLGAHAMEASARWGLHVTVPAAGTTRRAKLAASYKRLMEEGYDQDQFRAASVGVLSDEYMRDNGYVDPENVLRLEKIGRRADAGLRELERRAAAEASGDTDWGRFDS